MLHLTLPETLSGEHPSCLANPYLLLIDPGNGIMRKYLWVNREPPLFELRQIIVRP
ncbi:MULTISPECIES: hypothetical protein [unclassified Moorena]|uniref:hypothetical protein n=1 Tax=unclassified Moorena TaxID=2683338 RepID=UPI001874F53C|nr:MULTISPECIES: hypothetical protein [unclassified Moorena]